MQLLINILKLCLLSCCCLSLSFAANTTPDLKTQQLQAMKEAGITELKTVTSTVEKKTTTTERSSASPYKIPTASNYTIINHPEKSRNLASKNIATQKSTEADRNNYPQIRYY